VLVENFRPGTLEKWGIGYSSLAESNPRLIHVSITGFGQTGPYADRPGFGTLAEVFSGFAALTGEHDGPPTLPAFGLADGVAALSGVYAALAAIHYRDHAGEGRGQVVDVSLYEPLFSILGPQVIEYDQLGIVQERRGNRSPRTAPRNAYRTADDRWVALSAGTQQIADRILAAVERPELATDPRFSSPAARHENADEVDAIVAEWIGAHPLDEVLDAFQRHQAPIAPAYTTDQIVQDPQYLARETVVTVDDPDLGPVRMQAVLPHFRQVPGKVWRTGPALGQDNDLVYGRWLGIETDRLAKLRETGVI